MFYASNFPYLTNPDSTLSSCGLQKLDLFSKGTISMISVSKHDNLKVITEMQKICILTLYQTTNFSDWSKFNAFADDKNKCYFKTNSF